MIEINPEDLELMWVWNHEDNKKVKRWVVAKLDKCYIAVTDAHETKEEALKAIKLSWYPFMCWQHAEPIETKLTALIKPPEEIFGIEDLAINNFGVQSVNGYIFYPSILKNVALSKIRVIVTEAKSEVYDCHIEIPNNSNDGFFVLRSWLKDFREEE